MLDTVSFILVFCFVSYNLKVQTISERVLNIDIIAKILSSLKLVIAMLKMKMTKIKNTIYTIFHVVSGTRR